MDEDESDKSRRRFLRATGSVSLIGLAGCLGGGGGADHGSDYEPLQTDLTLPEGAQECVSIDGIQRDPEGLTSKEAADYQSNPNYTGESGNLEMCANCQFFCPVNPPDKVGACAIVEGGIHSQHWCAFWQATNHVENMGRRSASRTPWATTGSEDESGNESEDGSEDESGNEAGNESDDESE